MESEAHDKKLDAAMEKLVAIMSSNKSQVETLLAKNTLLAKQLTKNNMAITRLTKEMSNLVSIITKKFRKNHATDKNKKNGNAGKGLIDMAMAQNSDNTTFDPNGNCWTHKYRIYFNHISARCKYMAEGYKTEATCENTMRGNSKNKD